MWGILGSVLLGFRAVGDIIERQTRTIVSYDAQTQDAEDIDKGLRCLCIKGGKISTNTDEEMGLDRFLSR